MRHAVLLGTLTLLAGALGAQQPAPEEVTLKVVNYDQLAETVRQLRGKVVVVDLWEDT